MGVRAHHEHVSLSHSYMMLAAHTQMGGLDIPQPEVVSLPVMDEAKIVPSLDSILQTLMITKVNVNRSNKPSQDEAFWECLFSIHFSGSLYLKNEM